jgi:hypothetical protein
MIIEIRTESASTMIAKDLSLPGLKSFDHETSPARAGAGAKTAR